MLRLAPTEADLAGRMTPLFDKYEKAVSGFERHELKETSEFYPEQLKNIDTQAPTLYAVGSLEALKTPLISIIGARKATPYGLACAKLAGRIAAECGITVVSGGAIGCDSEAARAALAAGGKTIVVPGTGPDVLYPRSSDDVFYKAVITGGCILTNIPWGMEPRRGSFISRNNIIAGLSRSLVVCEAGIKSGTFSTASRAAELGRHVYAIPGSIFSATSKGTNHLLESGASIVCDEQALEILISLDYGTLRLVASHASENQDELLRALIANPMNITDIGKFLKKDYAEVFGIMSDYEAAGLIERQLDGKYCASKRVFLSG